MDYARRIVGNMLGQSPRGPAILCGDRRGKNMVRYNYFLVTLEDGSERIEYGGSISAVRNQLKDQGVSFTSIKEIPYAIAKEKLNDEQRYSLRRGVKGVYSNTGNKILDKEGNRNV